MKNQENNDIEKELDALQEHLRLKNKNEAIKVKTIIDFYKTQGDWGYMVINYFISLLSIPGNYIPPEKIDMFKGLFKGYEIKPDNKEEE